MAFKPEEVSSVLEQELEKYESRLKMESVGTVLQTAMVVAGHRNRSSSAATPSSSGRASGR